MRNAFLILALVAISFSAFAGPKPGDVFRVFTYAPVSGFFAELDPNCPQKANPDFDMRDMPHQVVKLLDLDLRDAVRAEMSVEYWGGHIGTSDQKFRVNGHEWAPIPQPKNTPTSPSCYYRTMLGNDTVDLPLSSLRDGCNEFQFTCGPQICYNFNWGFYWIYSFTVYVYYPESKPHPSGGITSPKSGATIGDNPKFTAEASSPNGRIRQVDYIGYYEDFDWDGNGVFEGWQYQTQQGILKRHIGNSTCSPYEVEWANQRVPDQGQSIRVMAKITDESGMCYMTQTIDNLSLERKNRRVKMFKAVGVPEAFGVRVSERKTCKFVVPEDLSKAKNAQILLSTWSAVHGDEIGLNGKMLIPRLGRIHDYSYDSVSVPLDLIKTGTNEFHIFAKTDEHALEVNWPGPVLIISYGK